MADLLKNISKKEVLNLKEEVAYQDGQIVSKTLAQNEVLPCSHSQRARKSAHTLPAEMPL